MRAAERRVLAAAVLASAMAFVDATALNVALPALQQALEASAAALLWVVNSYALVVAGLLLLGGTLGDRLGRRRTLSCGISLFTGASLACGLAPSTALLIVARAVQGAGAALMIPGSLALLAATFDAERRGRAIGTWSAWTVIATALGPVMGGLLAQSGWWRGIFFLNVPLAAIALVLLRGVPETRDEAATSRLDLPGALLAVAGLAALNAAFLAAPERSFTDARVVAGLAMGVVLLSLFGRVEARSADPLLPLQLLRSPVMVRAVVLTLLVYSAFHALLLFLPLHLIQAQGYDAALAGLTQLPVILMLVALSRWAGALLDRHGPRLPLATGPGVAAAGFAWLSRTGLTSGPSDFWMVFLPPLLVVGVGMALTMAPLSATILAAAPPERSGLASGINSTVSRLAGVIAVAVFGAVALGTFGSALERRAEALRLAPEARMELVKEATRFGAARPPSGLAPAQIQETHLAIRAGLTEAFDRVCLVAAVLCVAGALAGIAQPSRRS